MHRLNYLFSATIAILSLATSDAHASDGWTAVSESGQHLFSIKNGSFATAETKGDNQIYVVIGKSHDSSTTQISIEKWYVSVTDCAQGYGNLVTLDIDGNFKFENPYANGGGSVATSIAETICALGAMHKQQALEKSI